MDMSCSYIMDISRSENTILQHFWPDYVALFSMNSPGYRDSQFVKNHLLYKKSLVFSSKFIHQNKQRL